MPDNTIYIKRHGNWQIRRIRQRRWRLTNRDTMLMYFYFQNRADAMFRMKVLESEKRITEEYGKVEYFKVRCSGPEYGSRVVRRPLGELWTVSEIITPNVGGPCLRWVSVIEDDGRENTVWAHRLMPIPPPG